MRKSMALAVTAVLLFGAVAPTSAATVKVGDKCTKKLAVTKVGTTKMYCGLNTNAKTKKSYKLAWIKSVKLYSENGQSIGCYDLIVQNVETQKKAADAQQQMADIKAQLSKLDTATAATVSASVAALQGQVDMLTPLAQSLADNVASICP